MSANSLGLPLVIVTVGVGWLLSTIGVGANINWVWTLGLAVGGVLTFLLSGIDKVSVIVGPLLLIASGLSVLRQTDRVSLDIEVPILVIVSGVLLAVARLPSIPAPGWLDTANLEGSDPEKR